MWTNGAWQTVIHETLLNCLCQRTPLMLVQCSLQTALAIHQVDTEICEQTFSWLPKYSNITRKNEQDVLSVVHL